MIKFEKIKQWKNRCELKQKVAGVAKSAGISKKETKAFCNYFIRYVENADAIAKRKCSKELNKGAEVYERIFKTLNNIDRKKETKHENS